MHIMADMDRFRPLGYFLRSDGLLLYQGKICVLVDEELRQEILSKVHRSRYAFHVEVGKMYQDLRRQYWLNDMKRHVVEFVSCCLVCQQVNVEHQRPVGLLRLLSIPEWK